MNAVTPSIMNGRSPEGWDWFIDPVDTIISRLYIGDLLHSRRDVKDFVDFLGEGWEVWGMTLGTFLVVATSSLEEGDRERMKLFTMTLPQTKGGIDGQLFDCLTAMEWIMADPELSPDLEAFPMDNKYVFFMGVFCMLTGLFSVLELPEGATPSLTIISVIQASLQQ